jgi:hypothetical protein
VPGNWTRGSCVKQDLTEFRQRKFVRSKLSICMHHPELISFVSSHKIRDSAELQWWQEPAAGHHQPRRSLPENIADSSGPIRGLPSQGQDVKAHQHLPAAARSPPHNHAVAFGEDMFRQHFGCRSPIRRMHERFDKGNGERLGRFESRRSIFVKHHLVPGHEAALAISEGWLRSSVSY